MVYQLKLGALTKVSNIEIEQLGMDEYWIRYDNRDWLVWTKSPRWIEILVAEEVTTIGEMHYGPISTFYDKCILRKQSLPSNHGKKWVKADLDLLYEMIDQDIAVEEIAQRLGRSTGSVIAKFSSLMGLDLGFVDVSVDLGDARFSTLVNRVYGFVEKGQDG